MAPPLLLLQDIHLTFGGTPLLEGAELSVSGRERGSSGAAMVMLSVAQAFARHTFGRQQFCQRDARTHDVRLDLGQRDAQVFRDVLIRHVFEVIEHQGYALMIRQLGSGP